MQAQTAVVPAPSLAARRALAVVLGAALVAIAAQIAVPLPGTPVPRTLVLYLSLGAAGLPVFTPYGLPGVARLLGATGGYLLAYPFAAYAVGRLTGDGRRWTRVALAVLAGLALIHLGGLVQLGILTGSLSDAARFGTRPFLVSDLLKLVIAVLILRPSVSPLRARL